MSNNPDIWPYRCRISLPESSISLISALKKVRNWFFYMHSSRAILLKRYWKNSQVR